MGENPEEHDSVQRPGSDGPPTERSETVRALNQQLRKLVRLLSPSDDQVYSFFCECGCCESVPLTIREYDALEGAPIYLAGHPAGRDSDEA